MDKNKKKKWYENWWGILWTLAWVDASPGRNVRAFMLMDKEMESLPDFDDDGGSPGEPSLPIERKGVDPHMTGIPANCGT